MWTVLLRRESNDNEESFEFVNGQFEAEDDLIAFSQSTHLFIVKIEVFLTALIVGPVCSLKTRTKW
jgi:hypothetical protein